ncbi:hypothetical protein CsSME_00032594 [Camellia sinensis var. sinensis]
MAQGGNGGWIPVVRRRERVGDQSKEAKHRLFTVFVDNLPSAMDTKTLDVFIPFKKRAVTSSIFGFVRFNCPVTKNIAIQKANGLLVDERVLEVKKNYQGQVHPS